MDVTDDGFSGTLEWVKFPLYKALILSFEYAALMFIL